jgi:Zinc finger, C2H2 type
MEMQDNINNFADLRCYNCGKQFNKPSDLQRHKNRKTPCLIREIDPADLKNPNRCIYCNRIFSTIGNLKKHSEKCKVKNGGLQTLHDKVKHEEAIRIITERQDQKNKEFESLLSVMKTQMEEQSKKNNELETRIKELSAGGPTISCGDNTISCGDNTISCGNNTISCGNNIISCGNVTNITNNNINVIINNYNKPNIAHLNDIKSFSKLLNYELSGTPMALINKIWYDPDHPENSSIHLVNKKTGESLVIINGKWITENASNIIPVIRQIVYEFTQNMIMKNFDVLINFGNDMVPRFLELNRKDDGSLKRETEEILQKMIDGRKISQICVDKYK